MTARALAEVGAGEPLGGYWVDVRCPGCDGRLEHVAAGTPGSDTRAVARCPGCRRHLMVTVHIRDVTGDVGRPRGAGHGTRGSYVRGCRCLDCTAGAMAYQREYRARRRQKGAA